jgi:tetratricopeptide (TPR) repeat protein
MLNQAGNDYKYEYTFTVLSDAYKSWGENQRAEEQYQLAASMVPHKFYPLYLLTKLYNQTGQHKKAVALALQILTKEIKCPCRPLKIFREKCRN